MKFSVSFGKHVGHGRLSSEQQSVVESLERDEISAEEAERLLGGSVLLFDLTIGAAPPDGNEASAAQAEELSEDEIARRLVERIAQEVDAETGG